MGKNEINQAKANQPSMEKTNVEINKKTSELSNLAKK